MIAGEMPAKHINQGVYMAAKGSSSVLPTSDEHAARRRAAKQKQKRGKGGITSPVTDIMTEVRRDKTVARESRTAMALEILDENIDGLSLKVAKHVAQSFPNVRTTMEPWRMRAAERTMRAQLSSEELTRTAAIKLGLHWAQYALDAAFDALEATTA